MDEISGSKANTSIYFTFFNEIGIIAQLSRALLEEQLPKGMTAAHFSVLNHLIRVADGRTPLELSRAFQVPKTSMTHTLTGLQQRGLVCMKPNPEDGRSKQVWLTDAGRHVRDDTIAQVSGDFRHFSQKIDVETIASLLPDLVKIREIMDADRD